MSDDPVARFRRAYWRAFRELDSVRLRQWEEYRLTLPQLRVLYHIRRAPGVTGGEIAAALGITVSTVSGLVGKLTERGLLARGTAPDDRRQAPLELTPEGLTLVGALSETNQAFTAQVAATLGDDLEAITSALERLAAAAETAHPADRADHEQLLPNSDKGRG
jgi:DNA-binding MarR family transcriptional regulator